MWVTRNKNNELVLGIEKPVINANEIQGLIIPEQPDFSDLKYGDKPIEVQILTMKDYYRAFSVLSHDNWSLENPFL